MKKIRFDEPKKAEKPVWMGYELSKRAYEKSPSWLWTTNNYSVAAMNEFQQDNSCNLRNGYYLFLRGNKLCLGEYEQ